jgi:hypothetical protein
MSVGKKRNFHQQTEEENGVVVKNGNVAQK